MSHKIFKLFLKITKVQWWSTRWSSVSVLSDMPWEFYFTSLGCWARKKPFEDILNDQNTCSCPEKPFHLVKGEAEGDFVLNTGCRDMEICWVWHGKMPQVRSWQEVQTAKMKEQVTGMWKLHQNQMNSTENWRRVLGIFWRVEANSISVSGPVAPQYLGNGLRKARSGYRCSKTGTKIKSKRRDRRKGSTPAGKKGTGNRKGDENHVALDCLLGSILFQHLSLNQDHQTKPVVLAMPHSPNQLLWLGHMGGKEYFPWQARKHPIRQVKHLNIVTAVMLPPAS